MLTLDETPQQKWTPMIRNISLQLTLMTHYGLRSLCLVPWNTCTFTRYQTSNHTSATPSSGDAPGTRTNEYRHPTGPTRPHQHLQETVI